MQARRRRLDSVLPQPASRRELYRPVEVEPHGQNGFTRGRRSRWGPRTRVARSRAERDLAVVARPGRAISPHMCFPQVTTVVVALRPAKTSRRGILGGGPSCPRRRRTRRPWGHEAPTPCVFQLLPREVEDVTTIRNGLLWHGLSGREK